MKNIINPAIAGVGNCASSLLQGLEYYRTRNATEVAGLIHPAIGPYRLTDIRVVAAFDVDRRHPLCQTGPRPQPRWSPL